MSDTWRKRRIAELEQRIDSALRFSELDARSSVRVVAMREALMGHDTGHMSHKSDTSADMSRLSNTANRRDESGVSAENVTDSVTNPVESAAKSDVSAGKCVCGHEKDLHVNSGWCLVCGKGIFGCLSYEAKP